MVLDPASRRLHALERGAAPIRVGASADGTGAARAHARTDRSIVVTRLHPVPAPPLSLPRWLPDVSTDRERSQGPDCAVLDTLAGGHRPGLTVRAGEVVPDEDSDLVAARRGSDQRAASEHLLAARALRGRDLDVQGVRRRLSENALVPADAGRARRPRNSLGSLESLGSLRTCRSGRSLNTPVQGGLSRLAVRDGRVDDAQRASRLRVAGVDGPGRIRDRRVGDSGRKRHYEDGQRDKESSNPDRSEHGSSLACRGPQQNTATPNDMSTAAPVSAVRVRTRTTVGFSKTKEAVALPVTGCSPFAKPSWSPTV